MQLATRCATRDTTDMNGWKVRRYPGAAWPAALLAMLVTASGCVGLGGIGGYTLVDSTAMSKVQALNDPELTGDAKRMEGKSMQAGTPDYYAAMCLHQYIDARYGEQGGAGQPQSLGFGACASTCQTSAQQLKSQYSDLAAKYQSRCAQGAASQSSKMIMDALANQVQVFQDAQAPLELFIADRDCRQALDHAGAEYPSDPRLAQLADTVNKLGVEHAAAIRDGKAFFDSAEAQDNMARREGLDAERRSLRLELDGIKRQQDDLTRNGSLDAYMEKRRLDDQLRAKQQVLDVKDRELDRLSQDYTELAIKRRVLFKTR